MDEAMLVLERQFEWIREAVRSHGPKSFVTENTIERDSEKGDATNPYGPPSALTYSIRIMVG